METTAIIFSQCSSAGSMVGRQDTTRRVEDLAYAKLGRTYIYTQADVEKLINKNHIEFVA